MSEFETNAVVVHELSRSFRGKTALSEINLEIPQGCVFGLVGLNGAGKTTLIRHLIGRLRAQSGSVTVLGRDPIDHPEKLLQRIGYLTEEDSLPSWISVGEMIDFLRAIYPTWDDTYAAELCETFSLSRNQRLKSLSKGGRARVGLTALLRSGLESDANILKIVGIWIVGWITIASVVMALIPDDRVQTWWCFALVALIMPLARLLILPVSVAHDRHQ